MAGKNYGGEKMLFQVLETAKHGFKSSGVELNYWLVLYSRYQAWKQGQKNAAFYRKDLWKVTYGRKFSGFFLNSGFWKVSLKMLN